MKCIIKSVAKPCVVYNKNYMAYDYDKNPQGISKASNYFDFNLMKIGSIVDKQLKTKKVIKILEIGCGGGKNLFALKQKYNDRISCFGVDISKTSIDYAKKIMEDDFFIVGRTIDVYFQDEKFDIILLVDILEHLENIFEVEKTFDIVNSKLSEFGTVFISCPIERNPFCVIWFLDRLNLLINITLDCFGHTIKFDRINLLKVIDNNLNIIKIEYNLHFFTQFFSLLFFYIPKRIIKMIFCEKSQSNFRVSNIEMSGSYLTKILLKIYHITTFSLSLLGFIESKIRKNSSFGAQQLMITCKKHENKI